MTAILDDLPETKRRLDDVKTKVARAEGTVARIANELKTRFGLNSRKEALADIETQKQAELDKTRRYVKVKKRLDAELAEAENELTPDE